MEKPLQDSSARQRARHAVKLVSVILVEVRKAAALLVPLTWQISLGSAGTVGVGSLLVVVSLVVAVSLAVSLVAASLVAASLVAVSLVAVSVVAAVSVEAVSEAVSLSVEESVEVASSVAVVEVSSPAPPVAVAVSEVAVSETLMLTDTAVDSEAMVDSRVDELSRLLAALLKAVVVRGLHFLAEATPTDAVSART